MNKQEIKDVLDTLLSEEIITNDEYKKFINELDSSKTEEVKLKLREFLNVKKDLLRNQILRSTAEYGDVLNELAESFKDDLELQGIVNEFNKSIENAVKEFDIEMDEIEKGIKVPKK